VRTSPASYGDKPYSLDMALPPLSALIYRLEALPEENEIPAEVLSFLAI